MNQKMMFRAPILFIIALLFSFHLVAQSESNKWVVGAGISVAKFGNTDIGYIGDQFNFQIPRLNVSRHLFKGLTLDAGISFNTLDKIPGILENEVSYFSIDGATRYDFGMSNDNLVPYVVLGAGIVKTTGIMTPTYNFGGGGTYWLNSRYGINTQLIYKYSSENFTSMRSHLHFSVAVVYSLKQRSVIDRLWTNNR